jgi:hypothetical protein
MNTAYVVTGTMTGPQSVTLDEPVGAAGRVRVVIEAVPASCPSSDAVPADRDPVTSAIERRRTAERDPEALMRPRQPLISVAEAIEYIDRVHAASGFVPRTPAEIEAEICEGREDREFP